ncbi:hypothetical protein SNEBB_009020 [Seison nebaliae]|nr:hypothetical protein SNEBB_009020 [Seison nebaliae]
MNKDWLQLRKKDYYWGNITKELAAVYLRIYHHKNKGERVFFLLRDSSNVDGMFTISLILPSKKIIHHRIQFVNGKFAWCNRRFYRNIIDLVEKQMNHYSSTIPSTSLSRNNVGIFSLKHWCRYHIVNELLKRNQLLYDSLNSLKLPPDLMNYMKNSHVIEVPSTNKNYIHYYENYKFIIPFSNKDS